MKNVVIRFAKDYDVEDMAEIHAFGKKAAYSGIVDESFLDKAIEDKVYRNEQMMTRYCRRNSIVAEVDGEVVGFAQWVFGNESSDPSYANAELCSLYVRPDCKGFGFGTKLLNRIKEFCTASENYNMALFCLKDNIPAIKFYNKNGGKIIKEQMIKFGDKEYESFVFLFDLKNFKY